MVTIRYYKEATGKEFETQYVVNIGDFLRLKNFTRDELLDLRFFKTDILGAEIDTANGEFLTVSKGEVEIYHTSNMPQGPALPYLPYIIAALTFAASVVMMNQVNIPNVGNRKQSGATNSLGQSENDPAVNQRIDDVFGTVKKHTPPLWQAPYRIGRNNQETEVLLVAIGRGKYDIDTDNIYDGYTPYVNIPNAQANIYEPNTWPGNGLPAQQIRGVIDEPIGVYRESNDLNASELLPPNDLTLGEDADWDVVGSGGNATLTLENASELGVDLQDYFSAGQDVQLIDTFVSAISGETKLYRQLSVDPPIDIDKDFTEVTLTDMSGTFEITSVTSNTLTITGGAWGVVAGEFVTDYYNVLDNAPLPLFITLDSEINEWQWYQDAAYTQPISVIPASYNPDVGQIFDNIVGPISIYKGATRIILNLTSASGFYKIDGTTYRRIDAGVQFVIEELDSNNNPTGVVEIVTDTYSSNPGNVTNSVYQTIYADVPFDNARVYGRRTTDRDKGKGVSNVDKMEWTLMYSFEPNPDDMDLGDVTLMHCVIPSNSQSRLIKARKTNLDVTRKITQYFSGGTFGPVESYATDDFAQILIHTALDPKNGRLNLSQINADNLLLLRDQIVSYFGDSIMTRFGYDFDTTDMSYEDMFMLICSVVHCLPYVQNGSYDAFFEKLQPTSTMQITVRNKISESEVREDVFYKEFDGVELSFRNETTGVSETIYVPEDRSAINPERIEFAGCVTRTQAIRKAKRARNKQIYGVSLVEIDLDEYGRLIVPGQRVDSPDGTRFVRHKGNTDGYRVYEGEIVEVVGLNVELSEPIAFVNGEDHYIRFTNKNGDSGELIQCVEGEDEFSIVLSSTPSEPLYDGYGRDKTKYTFCSEQLRESIALIPQTIEFRMDDGQEINTISCINYDSRYYKDDLETI